ncbi:MAG: GNAT family N-acetyltransferase [Spirochaetaceae bacterium]|nr:MAG: GNAT family N-acetyltransferase [Spirochaetaceae bacterium]
MKFVLSRELVDQIVFAMENQECEYVLDVQTMQIEPASEERADDPQRFVPLPVWESVDGYNLMERFTGTLNNPVYRERLGAILSSGRGVFRNFKNALKERPDIERLWLRFKDREMQNLVVEWYNDACEFLGLDPEDPQFQETDDLVLSDFVMQHYSGPLPDVVADYARECAQSVAGELFAEQPADYRDFLAARLLHGMPAMESSETLACVAEGPEGRRAGLVCGQHHRLDGGRLVAVLALLAVEPEFRGLGIATALLHAYLHHARSAGVSRVLVSLPGSADVIRGSLEELGFESVSTVLELDLPEWVRSQR